MTQRIARNCSRRQDHRITCCTYDTWRVRKYVIKWKNVICEMEDFVETHLCKLRGILRSRLLRVLLVIFEGDKIWLYRAVMETASGNSCNQFLRKNARRKAILMFPEHLVKRGSFKLHLNLNLHLAKFERFFNVVCSSLLRITSKYQVRGMYYDMYAAGCLRSFLSNTPE